MMNFRAPISVVLLLLLAGCASDIGSKLPSTACELFSPITWSKKDTRPTLRQVFAHNAVWVETCR